MRRHKGVFAGLPSRSSSPVASSRPTATTGAFTSLIAWLTASTWPTRFITSIVLGVAVLHTGENDRSATRIRLGPRSATNLMAAYSTSGLVVVGLLRAPVTFGLIRTVWPSLM